MKKLLAIGEALIDFIPEDRNMGISDVSAFKPKVGGAPANVCGAFTKLGGKSAMITKLGDDPFGDKIINEFVKYGIDTSHVYRTTEANTSLAFVALKSDGQREFSFYRKPGADMLLKASEIEKSWFSEAYALHFCSVSLGDFPMKEAHDMAIKYAFENNVIISFDPNVRLPLWEDVSMLKKVINEYIPKCNILKISDEELEFITGESDINTALDSLFVGNVKLVLYSMGADGAMAFTRNKRSEVSGIKVEALDTTGAGDGFIGSLLHSLSKDGVGVNDLENLSQDDLERYLQFSNKFSAYSVQKEGAIASYPECDQI